MTATGQEYLAQVRTALGLLAAMPLRQRAQQRTERLRITAPPTFARQILVPRLEQFTTAYPQIEIEVLLSVPFLAHQKADTDIEVRHGTHEALGGTALMADAVPHGPRLVDLGLTLEAAVSAQGVALARPSLAEGWLRRGALVPTPHFRASAEKLSAAARLSTPRMRSAKRGAEPIAPPGQPERGSA